MRSPLSQSRRQAANPLSEVFPFSEAFGFTREYAAARRKSGAGNTFIKVSIYKEIKSKMHNFIRNYKLSKRNINC